MVKILNRSFRNWKYFLNLLPTILVVTGNLNGGGFSLLNFVFSFFLLGLLELFLPEDKSNDSLDNELPEVLMALSVLAQFISLSSLIYGIHFEIIKGYWIIGAALSTGASSGTLAIVVAHELIHRKNQIWNFMGRLLLFTVFNPYFFIHHLKIHHKHVGTDADPVTARYGENYYHFLIRSVYGQIRQAFNLEKNRCEKNGHSAYGIHNYILSCAVGYVLTLIICLALSGWELCFAILLQALFANLLLEYTNYIEHYGLYRKNNERVNESHSWQSDKVISRFLLIDLSRHSDHHFHASKPFHQLESHERSPVLPGGYASMLIPALIPPLWFWLVNTKIAQLSLRE